MGAPLHTGDDNISFAKVRLGLARRMGQRYEHLALTTTPFSHVILDDGVAARKAVLVAETIKDPLRRVTLLAVNRAVIGQNTLDDRRERIQLRARDRMAATLAGGLRIAQDLLHSLAGDAKPTGRLALAQTLNMASHSYA